jgi:NAD(P)-dependent dehydrogenase (short-subunit alcohol dehydrogenase family)
MGMLDGRIALVTGAGQGVGQGIALALAAEGAKVAERSRRWSRARR